MHPAESPALDYTTYQRAEARRVIAKQHAVQARYQCAWGAARRAAELLRQRYAAQRVVVFGSLLHQDRFGAHSDVDIAVWGIPWPAYLHALGEVLELEEGIEINLVDIECCHSLLREAIEREGQDL